MGIRARVSLASLLTIVSGAVLLSAPAPVQAEAKFDCVDSVRAYCEYIASSCASGRARCWYTTSPCQITNSQCITALDEPPVE
jgi:paraquat-inducible protein B